MESQAKYILVGSFVLIIALLMAVSAFWLSDTTGGRNMTYYTVLFREQSLDGLQKDSNVTMKGIKVGSVANYNISPENVEEVRVLLRLYETTPVKLDTTAVLQRNLLTGIATIDLVGGSQKSALRESVPAGETYPVIPEGQREIDKLADSIPGLMNQINEITQRASMVMSEENITLLNASLKNVEQVSGTFAKNGNKITSILSKLDTVASDISEMSKALKDFAKKSDSAVGSLSSDSAKTLSAMQDSLDKLDTEVASMSRSIRNASQVFAQEITTVSQSISDASDTFSRTIEDFEDPQTIITGPREKALGPGEALID